MARGKATPVLIIGPGLPWEGVFMGAKLGSIRVVSTNTPDREDHRPEPVIRETDLGKWAGNYPVTGDTPGRCLGFLMGSVLGWKPGVCW